MGQDLEEIKQLPEKMEQYPEIRGIIAKVIRYFCASIEFLMILFAIITCIRFFNYNPDAKNSIWCDICSVFVCVLDALFSTFLPLVLGMSDKNVLKNKVVSWFIVPEKREQMIRRMAIAKIILIGIFVYAMFYAYPRSFAPKIYDMTYKKHEETVANTTDIKVTVVTSLTVHKISFYDNGVHVEGEVDYEDIGKRRKFNKVIAVNAEDNKHTISAKIFDVNSKEVLQTMSREYIIDSGESADTVKTVCIPVNINEIESLSGVADLFDPVVADELKKIIKKAESMLDAYIVVTTNKKMAAVTVYAVSETQPYKTYNMKKIDENTWYFDAKFLENSFFQINVTAYAEDGEIYKDQITVRYPFE